MLVASNSWAKTSGFIPREITPDFPEGDLQKGCNVASIEMARRYGLPLLLTLDSHMVAPEKKFIQDILLGNGNPDGWRYASTYFQMNEEQAWMEWFDMGLDKDSFDEGVANNELLVGMASGASLPSEIRLPRVVVPENIRESAGDDPREQNLAIVLDLIKKHGRMPPRNNVYKQRLADELEVIGFNGEIDFLPYFIFLEDLCSETIESGDYIGVGRGSAAGCLTAYLLGITHLDPIKYGLSFSRFLSLARIRRKSYPDIDIDLGQPEAASERLKTKFGEMVSRISTVTTIKAKSAVRDVARALLNTKKHPDIAEAVDEVAKSISFATQVSSDQAKALWGYEDSEGHIVPGEMETNQTLADFMQKHPEVEQGVRGILGIPRAIGRHAAAYVVTDCPVEDIVPICSVGGEVCTQFTMKPVEKLGLLKVDVLGVNTLNDIKGCIDLVNSRHNANLDFYDLPVDCEETWKEFGKGRNETVFQYNSRISSKLCAAIKPGSIDDLAQVTACGRPGTLDALMPDGRTKLSDEWASVMSGKRAAKFLHQDVKEILEPTGGVALYQEQISRMFEVACGYTEEEADYIREVVAKKRADEMNRILPEVRKRLDDAGWESSLAESFMSLCVAASRYSFNKSHATAYAYTGYACQYLKVNYPVEWWTSVLQNSSIEDLKKNSTYCSGIVQYPDVNKSDLDFFVISDESGSEKIMYPLRMIKGIASAANQIVENKPYTSVTDLMERTEGRIVNKKVVYALIYSGAMDSIYGIDGTNVGRRKEIISEYLRARGSASRRDLVAFEEEVDRSGAWYFLEQAQYLPLWVVDFPAMLAGLGVRRDFSPIRTILDEKEEKVTVVSCGVVDRISTIKTKKGEAMMFFDQRSGVDVLPITVFPDRMSKLSFGGEAMKQGDVVRVVGKVNVYGGKKSVILEDIERYVID